MKFFFRVGSTLPQELLLLEPEDADQDIDTKAKEHSEPAPKKGRGKSEDADIELKTVHKRAGTSEEFGPVKPVELNKFYEFPNRFPGENFINFKQLLGLS